MSDRMLSEMLRFISRRMCIYQRTRYKIEFIASVTVPQVSPMRLYIFLESNSGDFTRCKNDAYGKSSTRAIEIYLHLV